MKKTVTNFIITGMFCGALTLSSCVDAKCVTCETEFGGQKQTSHECYDTNKEAREALQQKTEENNKLMAAYGGRYKCTRGKS